MSRPSRTLVLQEAEEVQQAAVLLPVRDEVLPLRALEKLAAGKSVVDALQLLHDDAARAHVQVAHLARALVAVGQAHGLAAAVQQAVRIARPYLVDDGRLRRRHGIAVVADVHAPPVANDQYNWSHFLLYSILCLLRENRVAVMIPCPPPGGKHSGETRLLRLFQAIMPPPLRGCPSSRVARTRATRGLAEGSRYLCPKGHATFRRIAENEGKCLSPHPAKKSSSRVSDGDRRFP